MSTRLEYNGVVFHGCKTVAFDQEVVPDPSGTDAVRHEFTITVQGIVHQWTAAPQWVEGASGSNPSSGVALMADLHKQLGYYRRKLIYSVDGITLLEVDAANEANSSGEFDVDNGPKPVSIKIVHVARQVFRVLFTVKCAVIKCDEAGRTPDVVSNRWSFEDSLDEDFVLTRTMDGRIRTSSIKANPSSFRHLVVPPLPRGFRLSGAKFVQDPNGIELGYTITHKKEHASPPAPAIRWDAKHEVTSVRGGLATSNISVSLTGSVDVNRRQLLGAALSIVEARVGDVTRSFEDQKDRGIILETISITDHLSKPVVDISVLVTHAQGNSQGTAAGAPPDLGNHLSLPGYDHEVWPQPKTFSPDSLSSAFQQYLVNPCSGPFGSGSQAGTSPAASRNTPSPGRSASETFVIEGNPNVGSYEGKLSGYQTRVSSEMRENLYTYYTIKNRYTTRGRRVALPIAKAVDESGLDVSGGPTVAIIALGPGVCHRIVHIMAEQVGKYPRVPAPEDIVADVPQYLIDNDLVPHAPELLPDGASQLFRIEAKYTYALERPPQVNESIPVGALPIDTTKPKDNEFKITTGAPIL